MRVANQAKKFKKTVVKNAKRVKRGARNAANSLPSIKKRARKSIKRSGLARLFSSSANIPKTNFSTHFVYGAFTIDIKTVTKSGFVKCNYKVESKNFNLNGVATLTERSFSTLQRTLEHIVSSSRG